MFHIIQFQPVICESMCMRLYLHSSQKIVGEVGEEQLVILCKHIVCRRFLQK